MKNLIIIILVISAVVFSYLFRYRQKMIKPPSLEQKKEAAERTEASSFVLNNSVKLPYRLLIPQTVTSRERLPLIIYLHGGAGRGDDNLGQLESVAVCLASEAFQKKFKSFLVIPQCPRGHEWVDIKNDTFPLRNYNQKDTPESIYLKMVTDVMGNLIDQYPIDPNRCYVVGFSMGATGTWDIITRHPEKFAAAVIMSGRSDPSQAQRISKLPIWVFHGRFDRVSPIANTHAMIIQLKKFGGKVKLSELFWGHAIFRIAIKNEAVFSWLFDQRKTL